MRARKVLETVIYCADLEAAERFYAGVLEFTPIVREADRHVFFRLDDSVLLVFNPDKTILDQTFVNGAPIPRHGAHGPGHVAFRVPERELARWRDKFLSAGIAIESEVSWPQGGRSIYVRDPAGNSVELATAQLWGFSEEIA